MKMEMTYRDKLVLVVVAIIVILVGGFFALIKPKYDDLKADQATYETTKTTWDGIEREINAIPTLKSTITKKYDESKATAKIFINSAFATANKTYVNDKTSYEMDQYLQAAIDESSVEVNTMDLGSTSSQRVDYYYHTPNVLTYSLLEAADINGDYAKEVAEVLKSEIVLQTRETADLMTFEVDMVVEGTKEGLMTFLEKIDADNNAILVNAVDIADYKFYGGLELGEDGKPVTEDTEGVGTSQMSISVKFFNAKDIDEPNLGA